MDGSAVPAIFVDVRERVFYDLGAKGGEGKA